MTELTWVKNKLFQAYLYYAETDTKFWSQFNFFLASWILLSSEICLKRRFLVTGKDCLSVLARIRGHCIKVNLHCRNEIYWKKKKTFSSSANQQRDKDNV